MQKVIVKELNEYIFEIDTDDDNLAKAEAGRRYQNLETKAKEEQVSNRYIYNVEIV